MDITTTTTRENNVVKCEFMTYLTINEKAWAKAYGEPTFEAGGTITYTNSTPASDTFDLPSNVRKINAGMPVSFQLNYNSDDEAVNKVTGWRTTLITRLTDAIETLMENSNPNSPTIVTVTV